MDGEEYDFAVLSIDFFTSSLNCNVVTWNTNWS